LANLLYEVAPGDPIVLAVIVTLIVLVSLLASLLPARRAAAVDPLIVLREE
jgi:ABC-type lipoprotein release transport system permease subunit